MEQLKQELQSINFDASNHKNTKLFSVLVRYLSLESGVNIKILELKDLPGETAICSQCVMKTLTENSLTDKFLTLTGDNENTNFGGIARRGKNKNIYTQRSRKQLNIIY